jgi:protein ImuB
MRIAAISLPDLHVEVVRATASARAGTKATASEEADAAGVRAGMPLAIVVAPAPLTEAKLLGNTRLDVVSREARALGVHPGQTIASARARAANLAVRVVRPEAVHGVLARLAEVSLAFGATVSFSFSGSFSGAGSGSNTGSGAKDGKGRDAGASAAYGDVVWVDVTGCAHLHAPRDRDRTAAASATDGEAVLAARLASVFAGLGHSCAVAIADGPRVAAILARAAASVRAVASARTEASLRASIRDGARPRPSDHRFEEDLDPPLVVVPSGKNAIALAPLPVSALPIGADDARWLAKLGVRTIGELRALPRSALASRLGVRAPVVIGLAEGDDRAPLAPYVPPEIPEEETTLEYGVEGSEALTFVAKTLADRLATRLAGRAVAASRIELDLVLDVALLPRGDRDSGSSSGHTSGHTQAERVQRIAIELPAPLSSASDLLAALRPKIERAVLRAPVLAAKLRAASLVHKPQAALSLFESQPKAERALPRLVAELAADLGEDAVGKLALGDAWLPEERSRFVRLDIKATRATSVTSAQPTTAKTRPRRHMLASVPEPTRILDVPVPVPREAVKVVRHLSRLELVDWWRHLPGDGAKKGVDYVHAWVDEGAAWVEIDRATGAARIRGWFD